MRLLLLADAPNIHTRRWCAYFTERGHDVHAASCERADDLQATFHALPSVPLPGVFRYPLATRAARALIARLRPDVVNAHFVPNYGVLAALAGARPLAITAWGSDVLLNAHRTALHRLRARWALGHASLVISDAQMLTDAVVALGVARDRTLTVPLGVDAALFAARKPRAAATAPLVVSTRRLEPVYDVETTIAAAAGAARSHAFTLEIAGDGSLRPLLQRSIAVDSMRGRVTFHGELNEARIADLLARADVYVSSSLSDSTSVSLLEAMSAGAFPVVSDVAANREWIIDGETGLLFPPGDAEALSRALARALDDGALRARAAERNRAVILARAARERCMRAVEEALCALARTT